MLRTPRSGTRKAWSEGVYPVSPVYQNVRRNRRPRPFAALRGSQRSRPPRPGTTTRIEVTTPAPQHRSARSTSCCSAYRNWVAQPGPSTSIVHTPSRIERTSACAASASPTISGHAFVSADERVGRGNSELPADRRDRVAQAAPAHRDLVAAHLAALPRSGPPRCATPDRAPTSAGITPAVVSNV